MRLTDNRCSVTLPPPILYLHCPLLLTVHFTSTAPFNFAYRSLCLHCPLLLTVHFTSTAPFCLPFPLPPLPPFTYRSLYLYCPPFAYRSLCLHCPLLLTVHFTSTSPLFLTVPFASTAPFYLPFTLPLLPPFCLPFPLPPLPPFCLPFTLPPLPPFCLPFTLPPLPFLTCSPHRQRVYSLFVLPVPADISTTLVFVLRLNHNFLARPQGFPEYQSLDIYTDLKCKFIFHRTEINLNTWGYTL